MTPKERERFRWTFTKDLICALASNSGTPIEATLGSKEAKEAIFLVVDKTIEALEASACKHLEANQAEHGPRVCRACGLTLKKEKPTPIDPSYFKDR